MRGKRIKEIRELLKMTQSEFGEKLGFSWSKIKDLESGKLHTTAEIALLMEKIYSIDLRWLLTGEGQMFHSSESSVLDPLLEEIIHIIEKLPEERKKAVLNYVRDQKKLAELP